MGYPHKLDKANAVQGCIGLDKKDANDYRLCAGGQGRLRIETITIGGQFLQLTHIAEVIREQWRKIGIEWVVQEMERRRGVERAAAKEQRLWAWNNDDSEHLFTFPQHVLPYEFGDLATSMTHSAQWFQSAGAQVQEPPPCARPYPCLLPISYHRNSPAGAARRASAICACSQPAEPEQDSGAISTSRPVSPRSRANRRWLMGHPPLC